MRKGMHGNRGFTFLEVTIVIAVMVILAGMAVPMAARVSSRARSDATEKEMKALSEALLGYLADRQQWPASLQTLIDDGYIGGGLAPDTPLTDAWGVNYGYTRSGDQAELRSAGPDRVPSADDRILPVNGRPILRAMSLDEMETIHVALRAYEVFRSQGLKPALPNRWLDAGLNSGALRLLWEDGLLPERTRFEADAWNSTYAYAGSPSDRVTSLNVP